MILKCSRLKKFITGYIFVDKNLIINDKLKLYGNKKNDIIIP